MHDVQDETRLAEWVRVRFGIDDEVELRSLLEDPTELLALFDVTRAEGEAADPLATAR